ncbi:MAG: hypothetical protein R3C61_08255 [Bacteroidia bacterium]
MADTAMDVFKVETPESSQQFFTNDPVWRGADGASSIDLGNGKILWLFSDSFIASDSSGSRKNAVLIRNSIAVQDGYDLPTAIIRFFWNRKGGNPRAFFHQPGKYWFWTGHGMRINDRVLVFLMKVRSTETGLGFEVFDWATVLIQNPDDDPATWELRYHKGAETYGLIAGSATVLSDDHYLYAFGAVEPDTHEAYALRWKLGQAYNGKMAHPEWWIGDRGAAENPVASASTFVCRQYRIFCTL